VARSSSRYAADAFAYKLMTDRRGGRPTVSLRQRSLCDPKFSGRGFKEYGVSDDLSPDPPFYPTLPTSNWRGGKLP